VLFRELGEPIRPKSGSVLFTSKFSFGSSAAAPSRFITNVSVVMLEILRLEQRYLNADNLCGQQRKGLS
jgi:hypothetical protein